MSQRGCGVPTVIMFSRMSSLHQLGSNWYVMNLLPLSRTGCAQTCVLSGAFAGRHVLCCFLRVSVPETTILIGSRKCCDPGCLFSFFGFWCACGPLQQNFVFLTTSVLHGQRAHGSGKAALVVTLTASGIRTCRGGPRQLSPQREPQTIRIDAVGPWEVLCAHELGPLNTHVE